MEKVALSYLFNFSNIDAKRFAKALSEAARKV